MRLLTEEPCVAEQRDIVLTMLGRPVEVLDNRLRAVSNAQIPNDDK